MKVKYYFLQKNQIPEDCFVHPEKSVLKYEKKGYHKCWAHQYSTINTYYMKTFFDVDFTVINLNNKPEIYENNKMLDSSHKLCVASDDNIEDNYAVVHIKNDIVFFSDKPCFMEIKQSFHTPEGLKIISGKFDISKWRRPVYPAFEVKYNKRINLKRETIISEISFHTPKLNEVIKLEYIDKPDDNLVMSAKLNAMLSSFVTNTKKIIFKK